MTVVGFNGSPQRYWNRVKSMNNFEILTTKLVFMNLSAEAKSDY
jgi:hypothetical protein